MLVKFIIKILSYLKSIKSPDVYILFLINNEIKKVYSLSNNLSPQPYIPSFKKNEYSKFSKDISNQHLIDLMQYCYSIDKLIKLGSSQNHIWHNLEVVVTSFVLKKPRARNFKRQYLSEFWCKRHESWCV